MILSNNLQIKKTWRSSITLDIDILKDAMCNIAIDIYMSNNGSLLINHDMSISFATSH